MTLPARVLTHAASVLTTPTSPWHLAARALGFGSLYLLGAWLSLGSRLPGSAPSLVWPAAGVATIWLLSANRRSLPTDLIALAGVCVTTVIAAGGAWSHAIALACLTLAAAWLMRVLVHSAVPGVRTPLEGDAARSLTTFVALAVGAAVAAMVEAVGSPVILTLLGDEPRWVTAPLRWVRSWTAVFIVTSTWVLLLAALGRRVGNDEDRRRRSYGLPRQARRRPEAALVLGGTATLLVVSLVFFPSVPITFAVFAPAAWMAVRFSPLTASSYAIAVGLVTTSATLTGRGIYASVDSRLLAALLAQGYFAVLYVTVITLALISTRLRATEQEAQARADLLDGVLAAASDGIVLVDDAGHVVLANRTASRLLTGSASVNGDDARFAVVADLGLDRLRLPDRADSRPHSLPHETAWRGRTVWHEDLLLPGDSTHGDRVLRFSAHRVSGLGRPGTQVLLTFSDVTTEHEQTSALQAFAGELAHDLKNPLAVVEGWSEMLEGEMLAAEALPSAEGLPMVRKVQRAAASMRGLIEDLLHYAVARGHVLNLDVVDLARETDQVVAARSGRSAPDAPAPVVEVQAPHLVRADRVLVRQLLDNLLGNAFKYVAPGTVPHVRVTTRLESSGEWVRVNVVDNGLGVPEEHRRHIFESLYRIDRPGYDGTGLGLSICGRIVDRHGGSLRVGDGPDGVGSDFSFTLPAARG